MSRGVTVLIGEVVDATRVGFTVLYSHCFPFPLHFVSIPIGSLCHRIPFSLPLPFSFLPPILSLKLWVVHLCIIPGSAVSKKQLQRSDSNPHPLGCGGVHPPPPIYNRSTTYSYYWP